MKPIDAGLAIVRNVVTAALFLPGLVIVLVGIAAAWLMTWPARRRPVSLSRCHSPRRGQYSPAPGEFQSPPFESPPLEATANPTE